MKLTQTEKLYRQLSATEKANLAFECCINLDCKEADIIYSNVEHFTYKLIDNEYRRRIAGLMQLSFFYGGLFWRTHSKMLIASNVGRDEATNDTDRQQCQQLTLQLLTNLNSMEFALVEFCKKLQVSLDAVLKMADCQRSPSLSNDYISPEEVKIFTEVFEKLMP